MTTIRNYGVIPGVSRKLTSAIYLIHFFAMQESHHGEIKRKKQVAEYELLPPCEMSGMPQQEDVILTEAEWRRVARVQIMFRKLAEDVLNEMGY